MKLVRILNVSLAALAMAGAGAVQAAPDVAKVKQILAGNACLACHAMEKKVVGPSYQDIAAKYKGGDAAVADTLAKHIKQGVSGVWGPIPMPPNPNINDADLKLVVEWIIAGAPQ